MLGSLPRLELPFACQNSSSLMPGWAVFSSTAQTKWLWLPLFVVVSKQNSLTYCQIILLRARRDFALAANGRAACGLHIVAPGSGPGLEQGWGSARWAGRPRGLEVTATVPSSWPAPTESSTDWRRIVWDQSCPSPILWSRAFPGSCSHHPNNIRCLLPAQARKVPVSSACLLIPLPAHQHLPEPFPGRVHLLPEGL